MTPVDLQKVLLSQEDAATMHAAQALSACMDAAGSTQELDFEDPELKRRWAHYHLIRDALKDPSSLQPVSVAFSARLSAALAREPVHGRLDSTVKSEPTPRPSFWQRASMAWPGLAMASAVASVVWIAQPLLGLEQGTDPSVAMQQVAAPAADRSDSLSGPTDDYVSAHRHMAGAIAPRHVAFTSGGQ